jgi:cation transport ATPase
VIFTDTIVSKVYIGPYVSGPEQHGLSPHTRKVSLWQAWVQVVRLLKLRLNPKVQRSTCRAMLALESLIGVLIFAIVLAVICGVSWSVIIGLVCLVSTAFVALFTFGLRLAWRDYKRQLAAVHPRRLLSPLAFRLANSKSHPNSDSEWSSLQLEAVPPEELRADDMLLVEPGQFIHADGFIVQGTAIVDEAAVTGESTGVIREVGGFREVMQDSLVVMGRLLIQVAPQPIRSHSEASLWRMMAAHPNHHRLQLALFGSKIIN